jgi:hypothetical protein
VSNSPEGLHKIGENFLLKTKQYLEATLVIDVVWTVYDDNGQTTLRGLDNKAHNFDALGRLKEGRKQPIYIEAKYRASGVDINSQYDDFVAESFSCFLAEQWRPNWDPFFMFVSNHPFKKTDYSKLTDLSHLDLFLNGQAKGKYGITGGTVEEIQDFRQRLWFVIWSNRQDLMCVGDPKLYYPLVIAGRSPA